MNKLFGLVAIVFVGLISIRLMNALSADAAAMAIGVLMGILAVVSFGGAFALMAVEVGR